MPDQINWSSVWQSIGDTWLPLLILIGIVVAGAITFSFVRKKNNK